MILPRPHGRPRPRQRPDRRSDMLRGAAIAVVALGMVVSGLVARGWQSTIVRQRNEGLDRTAASRTVSIKGRWPTTRTPSRPPAPCGSPRTR